MSIFHAQYLLKELLTSLFVSLLFQTCYVSRDSCLCLNFQPKIQDEVIAREIVINDAEPTIRYKLTKRQTQEEVNSWSNFFFLLTYYMLKKIICILQWDCCLMSFLLHFQIQKCTGAVVITRYIHQVLLFEDFLL